MRRSSQSIPLPLSDSQVQDICDQVRPECSEVRHHLLAELDEVELLRARWELGLEHDADGVHDKLHGTGTKEAQPPVIAILRGVQAEVRSKSAGISAVEAGACLVQAGFAFAEVPLNRAGALDSIAALADWAASYGAARVRHTEASSNERRHCPVGMPGITSCSMQGIELTDCPPPTDSMGVPGLTSCKVCPFGRCLVSESPEHNVQGWNDVPLRVGAGTVMRREQALASLRAGARFLVSPSFDEGVAEVAK